MLYGKNRISCKELNFSRLNSDWGFRKNMTFGTFQLFKIYCNSCTVSNFTILSTILSWSHAADTISFIGSRKGELVCCDFQNGSIWPLDDLLTWCSWTTWQLLINSHAFPWGEKCLAKRQWPPTGSSLTIFTNRCDYIKSLSKYRWNTVLQGDRISCKL